MKYQPTTEQVPILDSDESALIIAGPGRGKTVTAIAAARSWLKRHPKNGKVLFTSFSNAAVKRIAFAAELDHSFLKNDVRFCTFHSLAMEVLRNYGRFAGLKKPARPLDRTEEQIITAERNWDPADEVSYNSSLKNLAQEEGLISFKLMISLATALLESSPTIRSAMSAQYPFIIVDEFQDTRPDQWALLLVVGQNSRILSLADPDQMIYERQHRAALNRLSDFERWKGIERIIFNGNNFRCSVPAIIRFAEALLHGRHETPTGTDGIQLFDAYPSQRRAQLAAIWAEIRKKSDPKSTIAFIVPSNRTAMLLASELRSPDPNGAIPLPIYARIETDEGTIDTFRLAAYAAADWLRSPTEEYFKTLSMSLAVFDSNWSRKTFSEERVRKIANKLSPTSRATSPLRDFLRNPLPDSFSDFIQGMINALESDKEFSTAGAALRKHGIPKMKDLIIGQSSLFDNFRQTRAAYGLEGNSLSPARTTILSMYRSKGREFDFVVLVVEPRDHSQAVTLDELKRLYYVSATRARKWLGVLYVPGRTGPVLGRVLGR